MVKKFRAYDLVENEWINIRTVGLSDNGELWYLQAWDDNEDDIDPPYFEEDLGKTWVLLQSTGLKDKHGTEIYENYIVKFKTPYDKRFGAMGVIVWREDKACFGIDMEGTTEQFELYRITAENYLTVIGNIYQDKNLLEEE